MDYSGKPTWMNLPGPYEGLKIIKDVVPDGKGGIIVVPYTVGAFNFTCEKEDCDGLVQGTVYAKGVYRQVHATGQPCDKCKTTYTVEMDTYSNDSI